MKSSKQISVLVTGGAGAIGTWVTRNLVERGIHPVVYDLIPPGPYLVDMINKVTFVEGDILDLDKLTSVIKKEAVQSILHMAKYTPQQQPLVALKSNVMGSANVLEAARVNGVKRVVFTSSKSVYGHIEARQGEFPMITNDHPKFDREFPGYIPYYSLTNKMVEYFGIRFAMDFNMEFVITRFGSTWGPGKMDMRRRKAKQTGASGKEDIDVINVAPDFVCLMIDYAIEGKPFKLPFGRDQKDNLVYFKDISDGMVLAAISDKICFTGNHREFHFDAGKAISLAEVLEAVKRHIPGTQIELGPGILAKRKHPVIQCIFDLSREKNELGYSPKYADLDLALADYIKMKKKFG